MKQWEEKFEKAGVVNPEYVPISFGGKPVNIINSATNIDDIPYLPNPIGSALKAVPVDKVVNASNDEGGQRNIVGYSYGSIIGAYSALELANQGKFIDNVALVGSPIPNDSFLYNSLLSNKNIVNVTRVDIANDPLSNGIHISNFSNVKEHFYYDNNKEGQQDALARKISKEFNNKQ